MIAGRTRWPLIGVAAIAVVVGAVMVLNRGDDGSGSRLGRRVEQSGLAATIPDGWKVRPDAGDAALRVFVGSSAVQDPDCEGVNRTVSLEVVEVEEPAETARPEHFDEETGATYDWTTLAEIQCDELWQIVRFREADRSFRVLIRSGRRGPDEGRAAAYAILNTLVVN